MGLLLLAALLLWPGPAEPTDEPVPDFSVATWPARGTEAGSATALREVERAWLVQSADAAFIAPADDVEPLYLGDLDGSRVALVRSRTDAGRLVVAAAIEEGAGWRVLDAAVVTSDVSWLVLPGSDPARLLAAPQVAADASLVLRRSDGVWTRTAIRGDGVSATLRSLDGPIPVLGVVGNLGAGRGLIEVAGLSSTSVLPVDAPVQPAAPRWGRSSVLSTEEYDSALYASPALPATDSRLAVLASARVPGGRAVLVETQSAADGQVRAVLVVPGTDGSPALGPAPVVEDGLAAAVAPRNGGRALVLAASSPAIARVEVRLGDGTSVIDGFGPTAVVLAPPLPDEVTVLGKRTNGSVVSSLVLPLGDSSTPSPR